MRLWSVFRKSIREQWREPWGLALTLGTAPFFVLLYWLFFGGTTPFVVLVFEEGRPSLKADTAAKSSPARLPRQTLLRLPRQRPPRLLFPKKKRSLREGSW